MRQILILVIGAALGTGITYRIEGQRMAEFVMAEQGLIIQKVAHALEGMEPKTEIDAAIRLQRASANRAQEAITVEYVKVYCADHKNESATEKQLTMMVAAELSKLATQAGVGDLTLAEYRHCKQT